MAAAQKEKPRLEAQERSDAVVCIQVATGNMKKSKAEAVLAHWARLIRAGLGRARKARSEQEWRAGLAARGIGLRIVDGGRK